MKTKKEYLNDVLIKIQESQFILKDLGANIEDISDYEGMIEINVLLRKSIDEINKLITRA